MLTGRGKIDRFQMERPGRFMEFLKATVDGDRNMLDHTLILFGSGMNSGDGGEHPTNDFPLITAGERGLGIKQEQRIVSDKDNHPPRSNLLLAYIQEIGIETSNFCDATGTLSGLT